MSLLLKYIAASGVSYELDTTPGSYVITGASAYLTKGYALSGEVGSYAISGAAASLIKESSLASDVGIYEITGLSADLSVQQETAQPAGRIKKRLDLTRYNREVLLKILEEEAEEVEEERGDQKPTSAAKLGIFEPVIAIEAAMPRAVDRLISQGAEDAIPLLKIVYGEMLKKAKAEAVEAEDMEILLLAA